ncbi:MAG: amidohydrolase [bacterium]|nr:amidohydrolase [Deltaproteobacteria bacterium]MCP4908141.1 amidohydrolase [bacterium]
MSATPATIQDWVIDTDTHIAEPGDLWTSRLPAKYKDVAPRIVRDPETQIETWQIGDGVGLLPVGHASVAGWPEPFPAAPRNMDEISKEAYDAEARLAYMDKVGIWSMALYPNVGGFGSQAFLGLKDPELMLACVRAYNDFVLDWISPNPARFIPIMATPFWDVEASVKEIDRCAKLGHKGILFSGAPQSHGQPVLANPHWNPLWQAAVDRNLPVSFHIGAGTFDDGFTPERMEMTSSGCVNGVVAISLFLDNGKQLTDLLFSGVLPRFPELKVLSVESGVGFLPFLLEACDYTFDYGKVRRDRPEFKLKPSEYFARQVYGCYIFEETSLKDAVGSIGADNILFETDYPHPVCLYGNVREKIDAGLGGVSAEDRQKVLFGNAAKLYDIDQPDVAPPVPVG